MTGCPTPPARRDDRGVSLVEVLVAASLALVVCVAAVSVFAGAMRSVRFVTARTNDITDARIAMEQMTRELRVAVRPAGKTSALVSADVSSVSFYALLNRGAGAPTNVDTAPTRLDYAYDGTCVNVTRTPMTKAAGVWSESGTGVTTCLLRTTTAPQFAYFATGAIRVGAVDVPALTVPVGGLPLAALTGVQSVEVTLVGRGAQTQDVAGSVLRSRVTLANVLISMGG